MQNISKIKIPHVHSSDESEEEIIRCSQCGLRSCSQKYVSDLCTPCMRKNRNRLANSDMASSRVSIEKARYKYNHSQARTDNNTTEYEIYMDIIKQTATPVKINKNSKSSKNPKSKEEVKKNPKSKEEEVKKNPNDDVFKAYYDYEDEKDYNYDEYDNVFEEINEATTMPKVGKRIIRNDDPKSDYTIPLNPDTIRDESPTKKKKIEEDKHIENLDDEIDLINLDGEAMEVQKSTHTEVTLDTSQSTELPKSTEIPQSSEPAKTIFHCDICNDNPKVANAWAVLMPCNHTAHSLCIYGMEKQNNFTKRNCPTCDAEYTNYKAIF